MAVAVVVWAMLYYPHDPVAIQEALVAHQSALEREAESGRLSDAAYPPWRSNWRRTAMWPRVKNWRLEKPRDKVCWAWPVAESSQPSGRSVGIGALAARHCLVPSEVVLGTLGVIYNLGQVEVDGEAGQTQLQTQLRNATWDGTDEPVFNVPVALSLMVFFALRTNVPPRSR